MDTPPRYNPLIMPNEEASSSKSSATDSCASPNHIWAYWTILLAIFNLNNLNIGVGGGRVESLSCNNHTHNLSPNFPGMILENWEN